MELKLNKEIVSVKEAIFDGMQEQSVELDYILPDYYPEIFKLIKCLMCPKVISYSINGDRITYELVVHIRVMYCSEESCLLQCVNQKLNYSKTIELNKGYDNLSVLLTPKVDYVNCRVVNQRRLDIRGAVTIKSKIYAEQKREVISDAFGLNTQLKKQCVPYASNKITATKQFVINEDIELNMSNPPVLGIIRSDALVITGDKKIIANKLVSKGEAIINILYSCEKDEQSSLEAMQFNLPYSQIVDLDGINESFDCIINADIVSCDVNTIANNDGDAKMLQCELIINLSCVALKSSVVELVTDAYSTTHPCEYVTSPVRIEQFPSIIEAQHQVKTNIEYSDGEVDCIYDVWANASNINSFINADEQKITVSGMIKYSIMARNEKGMPIMLEKDEPFEYVSNFNGITDSSILETTVCIISCSYNLSSADSVAIKADLKIHGNLYSSSVIDIITDLNVDETIKKQHDGDYAVKLYYGIENEDIWEIAKKYSSSVSAIMDENELTNERLTQNGMIIIPILS